MLEKEYLVETQEHILEMINNSADFAFTWNGNDYWLDNRHSFGWLIVEPLLFNQKGGFSDKPIGQYPMSGLAKTPSELWALPFLEGKTISERFSELRFFDYYYGPGF